MLKHKVKKKHKEEDDDEDDDERSSKKKSKKFDRKKIASSLRKRVGEDLKRRDGYAGKGFFKANEDVTFFQPEYDVNTIDLVPFEMGDRSPLNLDTGESAVAEGEWAYNLDFWVHFNLGPGEDQSAVCPERTYGEPCPICEHMRELRNDGADKDVWIPLSPKRRNLYNVVCYNSEKEEAKGVQVWHVAYNRFQKIIKKLAEKSSRRRQRKKGQGSKVEVDPVVNFCDPTDEGKSISFSVEKAKSKNDFDEYIGHTLEDRDYELDDDIMSAAHQLDQLIEVLSYKELFELYHDEAYDEDDEGSSKKKSKKKHRGASASKRKGDDEEESEDDEEESEDDSDSDDDDEEEERGSRKKKHSKGKKRRPEDDEDEEEDEEEDSEEESDEDSEDDDEDESSDAENDDEEESDDDEEDEEDDRIRRKKKHGKDKVKDKGKKKKSKSCPADGEFGADFDEHDDCDSCDLAEACSQEFAELKRKKKKK